MNRQISPDYENVSGDIKKILPYLGILLVDLVILTYCPKIITFLPELMR